MTTLTLTPSLPSTSMLPSDTNNAKPTKRKARDESNPILEAAAAKKAKKDQPKSGGSGKRKLANGEQQPGGFVIVRGPSANPPSRPPSRAQSTIPASTSLSQPPPAKKLRASSPPRPGPSNSSLTADSSSRREASVDGSRRHPVSSSQPTTLPSHMLLSKGILPDRTQKLPVAESPTINHNRAMRQGSQAPSTPKPPGHRRRSSSSSRRKRTSDLFEETGVLTTPHASVADSSLFKYIDSELSVPDRINQLLIWCTSRAVSTSPGSSLSANAKSLVKDVLGDMQLAMAKREMDFRSVPPSPSEHAVKPNPQNVSNQTYQTSYANQIRSYDREHEAWRSLISAHKSYAAKDISRTKEQLAQLSDKARGKLKATIEPLQVPNPANLDDHARHYSRIATRVLGLSGAEDVEGKWGLEEQIQSRMAGTELSLDRLHRFSSVARMQALVGEGVLDLHYRDLSDLLLARTNVSTHSIVPFLSTPDIQQPSPHALLRALAATDRKRAPGTFSQGAMEARREVLRIEQSGGQTAGAAHRVTPAPPMTPKKIPGTPRRGNTPGRRP